MIRIIILGILAIIGLAIFSFYFKEILDLITKMSDKIRIFLFESKSLVDGTFMISYALIQWNFIVKITQSNKNDLSLLITGFILVLLTVMGIERLCLKSRFNYLAKKEGNIILDYHILKSDYKDALAREERLISLVKKKK